MNDMRANIKCTSITILMQSSILEYQYKRYYSYKIYYYLIKITIKPDLQNNINIKYITNTQLWTSRLTLRLRLILTIL